MSACIYHYCQKCKATSYYLAGNKDIGATVTHCLECGAPMKPVVRHGLPMLICKKWNGNRGNYKKLQQANSRRKSFKQPTRKSYLTGHLNAGGSPW